MAKSKIEWCDAVWNPITGCSPVSPGCEHCWARTMAHRFHRSFEPTFHPERLEDPLRWRKPRKIFVCSMGDLFHPAVPESEISAVFYMIQTASDSHSFFILTKRPQRMAEFLDRWVHCDNAYPDYSKTIGADCSAGKPYGYGHYRREGKQRLPLFNLRLGVSVENQETADERIPILLQIPAAHRFVSIEPMLGPVDLSPYLNLHWAPTAGIDLDAPQFEPRLNWIILGGETGPSARPMDPGWARSVRDQCKAAGVPFFFKQMGGRRKQLTPEDLMVREWPGELKKEAECFGLD